MKEFDPGEAPSIASITDKVRALPVGQPVTSIYFLGDTAVFVGAEDITGLAITVKCAAAETLLSRFVTTEV